MNEVPIARGRFLCEQLIVDHYTRNVSLINCFTSWPIDHFPSRPQRFSIFAALTNGSGGIMMRVVVARLDDLSVIYERQVPHHFPARVI
jgi:hypothetical protein